MIDATFPEAWAVKRLKYLATYNDEVLAESTDEETEIDYVEISDVSLSRGIEQVERMPFGQAPSRARRKVKSGDILISTVRTYLRAIAKIDEASPDLVASTGFCVVRPVRTKVDSSFLGWCAKSEPFVSEVVSRSVGVSYPAINASELVNIEVPLPSLETQKRIAQFLDKKTIQIDGLIEKKRTLLNQLAEKRQALITRAVTKGLDPNAPMKPSGIDWLGDIPLHWEIMRLKEVCAQIVDCKNRTPPNIDDGEFFVIRTSCLGNGQFDPSGGYWTDEESFHEWTKKGVPQSEDVLISREAPMGEACLFPEGFQLCLGQRMMLARANKNMIDPYFLLSSIYSDVGREYVDLRKKGTTVGHLRVPEVLNFPVIVPPIDEQRDIIYFHRKELKALDFCEQKIFLSIKKLVEYRSALITTVVTGQLEGLK